MRNSALRLTPWTSTTCLTSGVRRRRAETTWCFHQVGRKLEGRGSLELPRRTSEGGQSEPITQTNPGGEGKGSSQPLVFGLMSQSEPAQPETSIIKDFHSTLILGAVKESVNLRRDCLVIPKANQNLYPLFQDLGVLLL